VPLADIRASATWLLLLPGAPPAWRAVPWFESFVRDISLALQLVTVRERLTRQQRLTRASYAFARRLGRAAPRELHLLIVATMAEAVGATTGSVAIYLPEESSLAIRATWGYPEMLVQHVRVPVGAGVLGSVFATRRPLLVEDVSALARRPRPRYRTNSFMVLPLMTGDTAHGVVALSDRRDGRPFERQDLVYARTLAAPASLALSGERLARQAEEFERISGIDALTGLANRRAFESRLQDELQRARRQQQALALLMVDIDGFKEVNDTYGHAIGDAALQWIAAQLQRTVRRFDVCARLGGDEFGILLPGSDLARALISAERIRRRVEVSQPHVLPIGGPHRVTASIGVATLTGDGEAAALITEADRALYLAKAGRPAATPCASPATAPRPPDRRDVAPRGAEG
jgi:diguanylate cyclase (GGDEF)-like protein